MLVLMS